MMINLLIYTHRITGLMVPLWLFLQGIIMPKESHFSIYIQGQYWMLTIPEFNELARQVFEIKYGPGDIPMGQLFPIPVREETEEE